MSLSNYFHRMRIWSIPSPKKSPQIFHIRFLLSNNDDTETMILARLIFGEARNQSKEAMIGIAWSVKNRLLAKRKYFGFGYHEIIQKNDGRYYQFSAFIPGDLNYELLIDPFKNNNQTETQAWFQAYDVAVDIINGKTEDPTGCATYFHSKDFSPKKFIEETVPGAIYLTTIGAFLFYQDPNEI